MSDRERFDQLVRAHHRAVWTYARSLTADRWMAEEAVQETFARAWKYLDSFRGEGSFEGWLIRICRNVVTDLARDIDRYRSVEDIPVAAQPPDTTPDLFDLLDRLPLAQREVVVLCGVLGHDYTSASRILGVAVGTVRSRLFRGRAVLAAALEESRRGVS